MWRTKFLIVAFIGLLGIAAVGVSVTTSSGPADNYPARPITVVVPFPAGGPSDVVARVVTGARASRQRIPMDTRCWLAAWVRTCQRLCLPLT